jgi:hypothetical protein
MTVASPRSWKPVFRLCSGRTEKVTENDHRLTIRSAAGSPTFAAPDPATPDNFTIFEGSSEIRRLIVGRAVTGLDVR